MTIEGLPTYFTSKIQSTVSLLPTEAEHIALRTITQKMLFQGQNLEKLFRREHTRLSIIYKEN